VPKYKNAYDTRTFNLKTQVKMDTWNYILIIKQQILMAKTLQVYNQV